MLTGVVVNHVQLGDGRMLMVIAALALGSFPFAALGLLIGYLLDAESAQGGMVLSYFSLAILGGLFAPLDAFPDALATIGHMLPSSHLASLGRALAAGHTPDGVDVLVLGAWAPCWAGWPPGGISPTSARDEPDLDARPGAGAARRLARSRPSGPGCAAPAGDRSARAARPVPCGDRLLHLLPAAVPPDPRAGPGSSGPAAQRLVDLLVAWLRCSASASSGREIPESTGRPSPSSPSPRLRS